MGAVPTSLSPEPLAEQGRARGGERGRGSRPNPVKDAHGIESEIGLSVGVHCCCVLASRRGGTGTLRGYLV